MRAAAPLVSRDPVRAQAQLTVALNQQPDHRGVRLLLAAAQRGADDAAGALGTLAPLLDAASGWAVAELEAALAHMALGRSVAALAAASRAVALDPVLAQAWLILRDLRALAGDPEGAKIAQARHLQHSLADPALAAAAGALAENRPDQTRTVLEGLLAGRPDHPMALFLMDLAVGAAEATPGRIERLVRCLALAPNLLEARLSLAAEWLRLGALADARAQIVLYRRAVPHDIRGRLVEAAIQDRTGDYEGASAHFQGLADQYPDQPLPWIRLGHGLRVLGREAQSIAAYRRALGLHPRLGEAYQGLATLKTYRFTEEDVAAMEQALAAPDLPERSRRLFSFALGKAMEDAGRYGESFARYQAGAQLLRAGAPYDPADMGDFLQRCRAVFTQAFFAARTGTGAPAADPIFVVGLPRSGSTLIEQILASHSAVEGTSELADLGLIAASLGDVWGGDSVPPYPHSLTALSPDQLRGLGETYLERTRARRKQGRPLFVDKMPDNFRHVGLIQLILPRARIIDARRHPLGCGLSAFKHDFGRNLSFTNDLTDLGRYYADYVALMARYDAVLPGRVHRVIYERMVEDPESEVRRLLDYCGLAFEPRCLRFYETRRAVRTPSAQQVRQPIFTSALEQWRHYEPWLGPLKAALGPVLDAYPEAPSGWGGTDPVGPKRSWPRWGGFIASPK